MTDRAEEDALIAGRVVSRNGPVADAVIMISKASVRYPEIAAVSDDRGEFRLTCNGTGVATVTARFEGRSVSKEIQVHAGREVNVDLDLEA